MKRTIIFTIALLMVANLSAHTFTAVSAEGKTIYLNTFSTTYGMEAEVTFRGSSWNSYPYPDDYYTGSITIPSVVVYNGNAITVTRIAANAFRGRASLTSVTIPNTVTTIGNNAFTGCSYLQNISLPSTVTSLGTYVWSYCTALSSVTWPNHLATIPSGTFYECSVLTSVTIPNTVTSIGGYAFSGTHITEVTIPQSVSSIWNNAFMNCPLLMTVNWNAQNATYPYNSANTISSPSNGNDYHPFKGCNRLKYINIGNTTQSLPAYAFYNITTLKHVTFGSSLTATPSNCFRHCTGLDTVIITSPITSLGLSTFIDCDSLKYVELPSTLTTIGNYAFSGCTQLPTMIIPNQVTTIGSYAFSGCTQLSEITIPQTVTSLYNNAFLNCTNLATLNWNVQNMSYYKWYNGGSYNYNIDDQSEADSYHPFNGCTALRNINIGPVVQSLPQFAFYQLPVKNVTFGNQLTSISPYCFYNCDRLDSINITAPVTSIGSYAFAYSDSLKHVNFPSALVTIGSYAFSGCTQLDNISLPNQLTTINIYAFSGCTQLSEITIPQTVTSLYNNAFLNCTNLATLNWNVQNMSYYKWYNGGSYNYNMDDQSEADSYHPFNGCTALRNINIGPVVQSLPQFAFYQLPVKNVTFGNQLTSLSSYCFYNCDRLISIVIPQPVSVVGNYAFYNCDSLLSATLPTGLTSVNQYAFSGCSQLLSVTFPETVTSVGQAAYSGCSGFTTMSALPLNPPSVQSNTFSGVPTDVPLIVRCVAKAQYQSTNIWSTFSNYQGFGTITDTVAIATCGDYTWHGTNYGTSGVYQESNTYNGCDSVHTLLLTVNENSTFTESVSACNSYTWHGTTYTTSSYGETYTTQNAAGCDSIVTLSLTIWPNYTVTFDANGGSGNMQSQTSCSAEQLQLVSNLFYREGYAFAGWALSPNGSVTYQDNDQITLADDMTLYAVWVSNCSDVNDTLTVTACDEYLWRAHTYMASGMHSTTVSDVIPGGCDSIYTLVLTINYSSSSIDSATACDSYNWHGNSYTYSTNSPSITTINASGCDSIITLHLTIHYSAATTENITANESYSWHGNTYTTSGTYQWHGLTSEGCDSTVTLILVINHVGIENVDNEKPNITVHPNPTSGPIIIEGDNIKSIEVFDRLGRKVATYEQTNRINLGNLPTGNYVLRINHNEGTSVHRIILK